MKPPQACYFLSHKTYFYPAAARPEEEPQHRTTPFWCLRTHDAIGPDGKHCDESLCKGTDRPCYEPEIQL